MRRVMTTGALLLAGMTATLAATDPPATNPRPHAEDRRPPERPSAPPAPKAPVTPLFQESDADYSACLLTLYLSGAMYQELPPIRDPDGRGCGIMRPLKISQIMPAITLADAPVMRCETALQLGFWLRDFVIPATKRLPDQPRLTTIQPGSTYQCRDRIGDGSANISEHALGSAFDVMSLGFQDDFRIMIEPRQDQGDLIEAFQNTIQNAACLYFTTVLGPGSNTAHSNHLHLDIKARRGGYRLCQ